MNMLDVVHRTTIMKILGSVNLEMFKTVSLIDDMYDPSSMLEDLSKRVNTIPNNSLEETSAFLYELTLMILKPLESFIHIKHEKKTDDAFSFDQFTFTTNDELKSNILKIKEYQLNKEFMAKCLSNAENDSLRKITRRTIPFELFPTDSSPDDTQIIRLNYIPHSPDNGLYAPIVTSFLSQIDSVNHTLSVRSALLNHHKKISLNLFQDQRIDGYDSITEEHYTLVNPYSLVFDLYLLFEYYTKVNESIDGLNSAYDAYIQEKEESIHEMLTRELKKNYITIYDSIITPISEIKNQDIIESIQSYGLSVIAKEPTIDDLLPIGSLVYLSASDIHDDTTYQIHPLAIDEPENLIGIARYTGRDQQSRRGLKGKLDFIVNENIYASADIDSFMNILPDKIIKLIDDTNFSLLFNNKTFSDIEYSKDSADHDLFIKAVIEKIKDAEFSIEQQIDIFLDSNTYYLKIKRLRNSLQDNNAPTR